MRNNLRFLFLSAFLIISVGHSYAQQSTVKQVKLTDFDMQSTYIVNDEGATISSKSYQPAVYWFPVKVPSTVLTGLVANKIYPSPYLGLNNMLIPDASDKFNKEYNLGQYSFIPNVTNPWNKPYWYRTGFKVAAGDRGKVFQLIFKGINYRAAVWVNGVQIADSSQMAGMFAEYSLDISKHVIVGGDNILAVKIYPLDEPGYPSKEQLEALGPFYDNGGPTGDIGKNVTMLCSVGWDWIPPVRDRNMGIWQPVYLRITGAVTIGQTHLKTDLPNLPDTGIAKLSLGLTLTNHTNATKNGTLTVSIKPENFAGVPVMFSKPYTVTENSSKQVELTSNEVSQLLIHQPHLWWPVNYGKANLYSINLKYTDNNGISDDTTFAFGIRTVGSTSTEVNGFLRRDFFVNGKRVHLVGGAWVPDMMVNRDSARYDYEMHLCKNANVNLVRIWGGGVTPPDAFWNAADRYGLMVWSDFWVTGDTQGEFKGSPDWPLEGNVFVRNVVSTILRIRNHPSLLVWTGGNEGHARKELYDAMRNNIIALDGTRPFIPSSSGFAKLPEGWKGAYPDNKTSGVYSGGPYAWKDPKEYYKLADNGRDWVFKDETGIPSQPPYTTLARTVTNLVWDTKLPFPLNNTWGYHDACTGAAKYDEYYKDMTSRYGPPSSMINFSDKMQLMNFTGYQGIFEADGHKLNQTGGVMLWKLNSALPSVVWQIYDWYLEPNAGYYAMKTACEPLHVQFNQDDSTVAVINRTFKGTANLTAEATIYSTASKVLYHHTEAVSLSETGTASAMPLKNQLANINELCIIVLDLKNAAGQVISSNTYWTAPGNNYKALNDMNRANLTTTVVKTEKGTKENKYTLQITNSSSKLAFFVRPQLMAAGDEVMPSYWSANYFTLAPGQSITLTVSAPVTKIGSTKPSVLVEGWNVDKQTLSL